MAKDYKIEEYRKNGRYYIPTETDDLLWVDEAGKWTMNASALNMRSCMDLEKVPQEIDENGCAIILREFGVEVGKYELERIKYMNPLELDKSESD